MTDEICDCERSHNGLGLATGRPCDCQEPAPEWKRWYDERPPNERAILAFRLRDVVVLGATVTVEWVDELHCCGMGYADAEWWPGWSHWNGYDRSLPKDLEWRRPTPIEYKHCAEAYSHQRPTDVTYTGPNVALLPDPFTGHPPRVEGRTRFIGAGPWLLEGVSIGGYLGAVHRSSFVEAAKVWNYRAAKDIGTLVHAAHNMAGVIVAGRQWLRNIQDGISTPAEALANMDTIADGALAAWGDADEIVRKNWGIK